MTLQRACIRVLRMASTEVLTRPMSDDCRSVHKAHTNPLIILMRLFSENVVRSPKWPVQDKGHVQIWESKLTSIFYKQNLHCDLYLEPALNDIERCQLVLPTLISEHRCQKAAVKAHQYIQQTYNESNWRQYRGTYHLFSRRGYHARIWWRRCRS